MPHEGGVRSGPYQGLHLEGKNQCQPVGVSGQFPYAAGAPGPDLRRDIVEDRQPTPVGGFSDPKVESGIVDGNHEVDVSSVQEGDEPLG